MNLVCSTYTYTSFLQPVCQVRGVVQNAALPVSVVVEESSPAHPHVQLLGTQT